MTQPDQTPESKPPEPSRPVWPVIMAFLAWLWQGIKRATTSDDSFVADMRAATGGLPRRRIAGALLVLLALAYLLSGVYVVAPGEVAVVRRFGAVIAPREGEGLHYRLPSPIDRVDIVNVSQVRTESAGLLTPEPEHPDHPEKPSKLQAISGDTNVVDIEVIIQYQVRDPVAYLFTTRYSSYVLVRDIARYAVTNLVSTRQVDTLLTTERQSLQEAIRVEAQKRFDDYKVGLQIVGVSLQKVYPPDEVAGAFRDVASAREDKTRTVNEAQGYANSLIPEARGQAQKILSEAQAYQSDAVNRARGGAQAFESVLVEYQASKRIYGPELTRYRLYLETMDKILPRVQTFIVDVANGNRFNLRLLGNATATQPSPSPQPQQPPQPNATPRP